MLARDAKAQGFDVLYANISKHSCLEFVKETDSEDAAVITSCRALLELLFKAKHMKDKWSVIMLEGLSPVLFELDDRMQSTDIFNEIQASIRQLSTRHLLVLSFNLSPEGSSFCPSTWHQNSGTCFYLERTGNSTKLTVLTNALTSVGLWETSD
mmetsp:Transcript_3568/g.7660  ORF Transcript_3568/g.7660 Transcript_3568/m.7660 type:complete len:154 (-) Transcript_3568:772-1233(-)|eukprot:CAMPEP_0204899478 /NCGR_PEP_ID=MMETSP1397-20131031/1881_1 /ASSEMBLY_ACC=CAM_ASM_000891 /TAXON_ID=49980 /ORGANISM="Climacostomum Climacostomum virens, Strain Stock W-24" /LENGTH=153 /DNA_ID=CAMNT_0052067445 /DNA_START=197 /DNA_END=658 /DNA_ORIENTATION=-